MLSRFALALSRGRLPLIGVLALAPFAVVTRRAEAQVPSESAAPQPSAHTIARAEALFREGREAMRRQEYSRACERFRLSDALDPSPGTRLNWALCSEAMGHLAEALEHARWALDRLDSDDDRRPIAAHLTAELEKRAPSLTVRLSPDSGPRARVYLDDMPLSLERGERTVRVDPGEHSVFVEEPLRPSARSVVVLREGETASQTIAAGPRWRWHPEGPPSARTSGTTPRREAAYVLGAVGAASVVTAAAMAVLAAGEHHVVDDHCPDSICDARGFDAANRGRTFVHLGALALAVGAASAAGVAALLWPSPPSRVAPLTPRSDDAALAVVRRF